MRGWFDAARFVPAIATSGFSADYSCAMLRAVQKRAFPSCSIEPFSSVRRPATHPSTRHARAQRRVPPRLRIGVASRDAAQQSNDGVRGSGERRERRDAGEARRASLATDPKKKESTRVRDVGLGWRRPDGENTQSVTRVRTIGAARLIENQKRARKAQLK